MAMWTISNRFPNLPSKIQKLNEKNIRLVNNYDFLRVFAALCIIYSHSYELLNLKNKEVLIELTNGKINFSFIGLSIFFSISGYLIAKSADCSPSIINYIWKRFLRIQPLLIVLCILTIFFAGIFYTSISAKEYFSNIQTWTYFRNIFPMFGIQFSLPGVFESALRPNEINGSLWTLIVEERLYILMIFPLLLRNNTKNYFLIFMLFLNLFYLIHFSIFSEKLISYFNESSFFYALIFLNASALYHLKINFSGRLRLYIPVSFILFLFAFYFSSLGFLYFYSIPVLVNSFACVKGCLNRFGKYGDFTYGIYIFSFPVQQILIVSNIGELQPLQIFIFTLLIVVPIATLTWNLIEKPCLKLKHKLQ